MAVTLFVFSFPFLLDTWLELPHSFVVIILTLSPQIRLMEAAVGLSGIQGRCGTEPAVNSPLWASRLLLNGRAGHISNIFHGLGKGR